MTFHFVCLFILVACFGVVLTAEENAVDDDQDQGIKERPVGRSYSLTTCDYQVQIGYSCVTCNRALHCYPGNVAILVDCYGRFRFCRDGRCSRHQGEKCTNKATTLGPSNTTIQTDTTVNVATSSEAATNILTESEAAAITEKITTIDAKSTTIDAKSTTIDSKSTTTDAKSTTIDAKSTTIDAKSTTIDAKSTTKYDILTTVAPVDENATTKSDLSTTLAEGISSNVV